MVLLGCIAQRLHEHLLEQVVRLRNAELIEPDPLGPSVKVMPKEEEKEERLSFRV